MTIGTGIGRGIVIGGKIYRGAQATAGRIGHIIVDYTGSRPCTCGGYGCLEAYASATAITGEFVRAIGDERIQTELGLETLVLGVKDIAALAAAGHAEAQKVIQRGAMFLGIGIASLLNLLSPDRVIIGGGVAQIGESYLSEVRRVAQARAQGPSRSTPIIAARLGTRANLLGAAELAWRKSES